MKTFKYILAATTVSLTMASCYDMDLETKGVIDDSILLISDNGIKKMLALAYQDCPIEDFNYAQNGESGFRGFATVNNGAWHTNNRWDAQKASPSSIALEAVGRGQSYGDSWNYWPYDRIRDLNSVIQNLPNYADSYDTPQEFNAKVAEARFLRAFYYFGLVKRYGGVPIIDKVQDPTLPVEELQVPRNTEYDCWKFIYEDLKFAMENGSTDKSQNNVGRANRYAAAALMSRAMLYAGTIAKYGSSVNIQGPAVRALLMTIPAEKAQEFFQYSYDASKFLRDEGGFKLHDGADKEKAYLEVFIGENSGDEDIFVKQYVVNSPDIEKTSLFHCWDGMVLPIGSGLSQAPGASIQPSWELVSLYEMPALVDAAGKPVRFNSREELWNNGEMEPRARANFFFSGMTESVSGATFDIQAGIYTSYPGLASDGTENTTGSKNAYTDQYRKQATGFGSYKDSSNEEYTDKNGDPVKISGNHGVGTGLGDEGYTYTGTFIRKYVDYTAASTTRVLFGSKQSWKVFRYGEILCNWAEAAYELGLLTGSDALKQEAIDHVNELRARAGAQSYTLKTDPMDVGVERGYNFEVDENLQYIRDERMRELCFENQHMFDLRRWRTYEADFLNGKQGHTLSPYFVLDEGKWIFLNERELIGRNMTFDRKWYYEQIPGGQIGSNPNLMRNDGY